MNEENIELNLTLNVNEINLVLNSLGRPIESINNLIQKIKQQGEEQIAKIAKAQEDTETITENVPTAETTPAVGYI